jgi:hypothetical protein
VRRARCYATVVMLRPRGQRDDVEVASQLVLWAAYGPLHVFHTGDKWPPHSLRYVYTGAAEFLASDQVPATLTRVAVTPGGREALFLDDVFRWMHRPSVFLARRSARMPGTLYKAAKQYRRCVPDAAPQFLDERFTFATEFIGGAPRRVFEMLVGVLAMMAQATKGTARKCTEAAALHHLAHTGAVPLLDVWSAEAGPVLPVTPCVCDDLDVAWSAASQEEAARSLPRRRLRDLCRTPIGYALLLSPFDVCRQATRLPPARDQWLRVLQDRWGRPGADKFDADFDPH